MNIHYKISFFPAKEKINANSSAAQTVYAEDARLKLRIKWGDMQVDFNVGYRVCLDKWNRTTQRCKRNTVNKQGYSAIEINKRIQEYENYIEDIFKTYEVKNVIPSSDEIRSDFNKAIGKKSKTKGINDKGVLGYLDEFVCKSGKLNSWTDATYKKFASIRKHIEKYNPNITFDDFTEQGLIKYTEYLQNDARMVNSTVKKQIKFLKWFLRWCTKNGYCHNTDFITFNPKLKTAEKKIIFLDWGELSKVYNHQFKNNEKHLERVRDVFCFCCYTGLRYSDVANLNRADISDKYFTVTMKKTTGTVNIDWNRYSKAIIEKYADEVYPDGKALPVISNAKMNEYIKTIGKLCGINTPISITYFDVDGRHDETRNKYELMCTHTGRHTFICNALSKGIAPHVVMKWTGHSDYKSMKPYIDITDKAKTDAMKLFDE